MNTQSPELSELELENRELRERLEAAEETVKAIRGDEVDALVVGQSGNNRVYSLGSADEGYRTFVEAMGQGALTLAQDGTVLYCNRHFAELVRVPVGQLPGRCIYDFVSPENEGRLRALLWEAMSTQAVNGQMTLYTSDNEPFSAAITATPLTVAGATNLCVLVHDLTAEHAYAAAEATSAAKDRFLALLSHELRTPLTPVLMALDQLEVDNKLPQDSLDDLAMIRRNIQVQVRLIDDLLDLSRAITDKLRLQRETLNLHGLIRGVVNMLKREFAERKFHVTLSLAARVDVVDGDPMRLQQVLWNILKNAVKFSDDGRTIEVRSSNPDPTTIQIEVRDEGVGIDPAMIDRIFDAFQQAELRTTQRQGGLGLGLAIARSLVEAHDGKLTAQSDGLGHGATFTFTLPVTPGTTVVA